MMEDHYGPPQVTRGYVPYSPLPAETVHLGEDPGMGGVVTGGRKQLKSVFPGKDDDM
jgi:hypothetical protein